MSSSYGRKWWKIAHLHDSRCDSIALDFIGPLPKDNGYDCILTITDRLGADIRIIPTTCSLTVEKLAKLFFDEWYCENGLPSDIVSDHDKLFMSRFWKALHKLTGIQLKFSTSYHPQTDGISERTNKTVIQCIQFNVERDQKGWSTCLPKVHFNIMNTVNKSTGYTPFQLRFRKSPRVLPPLTIDTETSAPTALAQQLLTTMQPLELEAMDNLLIAKINQASQANKHCNHNFLYKISDHILLSTKHRRQEYKSANNR